MSIFPGSGNVSQAWADWQQQPTFQMQRSPSAEKRADRRAAAKADAPALFGEVA